MKRQYSECTCCSYAGLVGYVAFSLQDLFYGNPSLSEITFDLWIRQTPKIIQQLTFCAQFARITARAADQNFRRFIFRHIIANPEPFIPTSTGKFFSLFQILFFLTVLRSRECYFLSKPWDTQGGYNYDDI